jgi:hypothetical protein
MSRTAIAAALALSDVSTGERLAAFALASFANREQLAWPGTASAAARAGLGRSRYLGARSQLLRRGLIRTVDAGGGRGRSTTLLLVFARGPRIDGPVNARLFETVLSYSRTTGPARLLLASIAALADDAGRLDGVTVDELRATAGLAPSTYRRARETLIASGELELVRGLGGRGNTNCWRIPDPRHRGGLPVVRDRRAQVPGPLRPLLAVAHALADVGAGTPAEHRRTNVSTQRVEGLSVKGAQDRTVSPPAPDETQPEREPEREPP